MYRTLPSIKYLIHHCPASVMYRTPEKIQGNRTQSFWFCILYCHLYFKNIVYIYQKRTFPVTSVREKQIRTGLVQVVDPNK